MGKETHVFTREEGHAWFCTVPFDSVADAVDAPTRSTLELFEDAVPLGPPHSLHADIRQHGHGRYSHFGGRLYLSTSDNSDPNQNQRTYTVRDGLKTTTLKLFGQFSKPLPAPPRRIDSPMHADYVSVLRSGRATQLPVNLRDRSSSEVKAAAEYSVRVGKTAFEVTEASGAPLDGTILELGPGWDFGSAMLLGERAKRLIVADRFIAPWDDTFHPAVYREMQRILGRPSRRLDAVVGQGSYAGLVETLQEPAWDMRSLAADSVDVVYSNAVLEHVHPLDAAAVEMHRITRPGGWGLHQVDFRYHRDFNQPLEHLLFTREEYAQLLDLTHCETGTQHRVREAAEMFAAAGFEVVRTDVNITASEAYMQDFLPRLRRSELSPYQTWPADELAKISARIFVRKA